MTELDKSEALAHSALGADLSPEERAALADKMGALHLKKHQTLVAEGEARRTLFVLAGGRLSVIKSAVEGDITLYQLRIGECAGTRAFLDGSQRKAMLRAEDDTTVLTLEPEDFESLIETQPWLVYKVMKALFRVTHANLMRMNLETAELRNYMMKTGGRY